jgi:hypothetical protein
VEQGILAHAVFRMLTKKMGMLSPHALFNLFSMKPVQNYLFIFIILLACKPEQISENSILIRETNPVENLKIENVKLLKLQSNSFAQVASIDKILFLQNRIIVLDKLIGNSVFIYDTKGDFINHIYRIGEGPGEYKNVENVYWNPFSSELVLIPMDFNKKIFFDSNGNFIREEFYDESIVYADLVFLENGELIINNSSINGEPNLISYYMHERKIIAFPFDPILDDSPMDKRNVISTIDGQNYLVSLGLRDTLYSVDTKKFLIEPKYFLDFGNESSIKSMNMHPNPIQFFMENDFYVGAIDLFQNDDFLAFSTLHSKGIQGRIFSKNSGKTYSTNELIRQKLGHIGFEGVLGITPTNELIAVLTSGESSKWDFSLQTSLQKQFYDFGEVDNEELLLLIFEITEDF